MSTKDTLKAVQTVLDTFGPVMAALPAALDALSAQDKAERRLKQLESDANKLVDQYNAQVVVWEQAEVDHKARLDAQTTAYTEQVDKAQSALKDAQRKAREVGKTLGEKEKALLTAQADMEDALAKVKAQADAQVAKAFADAQARIADIEVEVAAVEKKYAATVKKLEDLKAKL